MKVCCRQYVIGNWKFNKMDGFGKLYYQSGKIAYEGNWNEDQFQGYGNFRYNYFQASSTTNNATPCTNPLTTATSISSTSTGSTMRAILLPIKKMAKAKWSSPMGSSLLAVLARICSMAQVSSIG